MFSSSLPIGSVIPYAGPTNNPNKPNGASPYPDYASQAYNLYLEQHGWLVCDGRSVLVAKYPDLFRVIGFIYGQAGPGQFLLPDYRGYFLRGVNLDAQGPDNLPRDPQVSPKSNEPARAASSAGGWSGNQVGSTQEDAFQAHEHYYQQATASGTASQGSPVFGSNVQATTTDAVMPTGYQPTIDIRQAPETRVKNVYVNFIIKYSHRPRLFGSPLDGLIDCVDDFPL